MASPLTRLDHWFAQYPHAVAGLEAISTFAAVVVSLALALIAQRGNRTKLEASASILQLFQDGLDPNNRPQWFAVTITNSGVMPLYIPYTFFYFKVPFERTFAVVNPLDSSRVDSHIQQRQYPARVYPRATETFYLSSATGMTENIAEMRNGNHGGGSCFFALPKQES